MSTEKPPKKRSVWAVIRKIWVTVGLLATFVFVGWSLIAYRASGEARASLESDFAVSVMHEDGVWHFAPAPGGAAGTVGLVFFPGALVDPVAYAPLARAAAQAGFPAWIVGLPRRGAFGGADDPAVEARMRMALNAPGAPAHWVVAGHSRGAVVASRVAANPPQGFAGLVLIGTSHPRDVDLSELAVPVTKIVGTRDGLASPGEVEANRAKLPPSTRWIWIEGGNHSQFGWYGFQPSDRRATVGAREQRSAMIRGTLETLRLAAVQRADSTTARTAGDTALDAVPDSVLITVAGVTLVGFYPIRSNDELEDDEDLATVLDDFSYHLGAASDSLHTAGVTVHVQGGDTVWLRSRERRWRFTRSPDSANVGYLLVDPDGRQAEIYGVRTYLDLFEAAEEFRRTGAVRR
ncbi:MAG TPA: alpha/beta family hydrolase [Gemmatimonadaceae bacterium]|nr:alpha/beta family hydrolase [Gemmatimonadaceae bacterium]